MISLIFFLVLACCHQACALEINRRWASHPKGLRTGRWF